MSSPQGNSDRRQAHREEVKRQREAARQRQGRSRLLLRVGIVAAAVAVIAGIVVAVVMARGGPSAPPVQGRAVPLEADCKNPPPVQCPHLNEPARYTKYNSNPPTSGPHWGTPAAWGVYPQPLPLEQLVHNLEHGGIVVYYNCRDCPELVEQLKGAVKGFKHTVLMPYYEMPSRIALTAWGYIDELDQFDEGRVLAFIRARIDKGPEAVP